MSQTRTELFLPDHHRQIEQLLDELKTLSRGDDSRALCAAWARFDRALEDHMRAEEEHLLPAFFDAHPVEARELLRDHAEIRRLVSELGVTVELHQLRADLADRLIERLREHARREDRSLYPWAARHLRPSLEGLRSWWLSSTAP
jgi:hemerythrin-like domain-containing protein